MTEGERVRGGGGGWGEEEKINKYDTECTKSYLPLQCW